MKILYPDYNNCLVNVTNSILKYYGCQTFHNTNPLLDNYLKKDYKNVVLLQLDALGKNILELNAKEDHFFRKNIKSYITSVFPPTTVAATTSTKSGLTPSEHQWLGWDEYFSEIDKTVTVFRNIDVDTNNNLEDNIADKYIPYIKIEDYIKNQGFKAYDVSPHCDVVSLTFDDVIKNIKDLCDNDDKKFIYGYFNEPDSTLHHSGINSKETKEIISLYEEKVKELVDSLKDTLFIITADHSQINTKSVAIEDYPDLLELLERTTSLEPRAVNFFIKKGKKRKFVKLFNQYFHDKFLLFTKKQVEEKHLFGPGIAYKKRMGDFLAVAIDDLNICRTLEDAHRFIGAHAGLTEDEMVIPLIIIEK